ncbi:antitoxin [Nonomuraea typhae]|uniref:Antitoxin n=1 Tax=Nonomuraea typhae TaxID=2603600 RepID=A0ABW7YVG5_9ACTN
MSIFDKVKEMFSGSAEKVQDIPEQPNAGAADTAEPAGGLMDQVREQAEDMANQGIDKASTAASEATGGKFDEHIATGTDMAKDAADKIDGKEG